MYFFTLFLLLREYENDKKKSCYITGMGAVTPCGIGVGKFWNSLLEGKSGVSLIEAIDTERHTVKIAAEIKDKDFNPEDYMDSKDAKEWTDLLNLLWLQLMKLLQTPVLMKLILIHIELVLW